MGRGYGIEQWEIEEMNERMKQMDPLFDNHPTVVEQRKRTAEFIEGFRQEQHNSELRESFERIIKSLNYDGPDTDSLTVGEIRRALP